jgi:hypothetical protein
MQTEPDLIQVLDALKNASPEEKGQLKALLKLAGMSTEKIEELEKAFAPPNAFRDKQRALDDLDRDFGREVAATLDNPQRLQELKRNYEQQKKKIIES